MGDIELLAYSVSIRTYIRSSLNAYTNLCNEKHLQITLWKINYSLLSELPLNIVVYLWSIQIRLTAEPAFALLVPRQLKNTSAPVHNCFTVSSLTVSRSIAMEYIIVHHTHLL